MTNSVVFTKPELKATRTGFGEGMIIAAEKNKNIVALCADLTESTRLTEFKKRFPERFIEVGVAEQNLATIAAGMALMGKIPFIASFAVFNPGRNWEQIRTTICYNDVPVKIVGSHAGLATGEDGATHQGTEDIALMRSLPNMTVIVPCDAIEARKATIAAAKTKGPVYLRVARDKTPIITAEENSFEIGKAQILKEGKDVTIIACGPVVYQALLAAQMLEKKGISAQVINNHTIKPIDKKTLISAARKTGAFVTVEDHQIIGGMGSAVAETISEAFPIPIKRLGVQDSFGESGKSMELLEKHGMTAKHITKAAEETIALKQSCAGRHPVAFEPQEAGRLLSEIAPEQYFRLWGGEIIKTVPELEEALKKMPQETFHHHVNKNRNDFSQWIQDCFGDKILAEELKKRNNKEAMAEIIKKRLKEANK
ncbi:MAG: transketolase C-terminal domain-containing protein [Candidatus Woesearchaeota archaeon]